MTEPNYYPACNINDKGGTSEVEVYAKPMKLLKQVLEEIARKEKDKREIEENIEILKDIYNNIKTANFDLFSFEVEQLLEKDITRKSLF